MSTGLDKMSVSTIPSAAFGLMAHKLRSFFLHKGFLEVEAQPRRSILAACEDPTTVATYNYEGQVWPLPQTAQVRFRSFPPCPLSRRC